MSQIQQQHRLPRSLDLAMVFTTSFGLTGIFGIQQQFNDKHPKENGGLVRVRGLGFAIGGTLPERRYHANPYGTLGGMRHRVFGQE